MATDYSKKFYKDYEKLALENEKLEKENKFLLLQATIAEDEQRRLQNIVDKKDNMIIDLEDEIQKLKRELERLKVLTNNDSTNSGIRASQTPINKKKIIPNFAKKHRR